MSEGAGAGLDFFAGCVAGTLSILLCHPLDTIRIRLQSGQFSTISECFKSSLKNEGARGLYKGLIPPLVGVSLINASLFGTKSVTHSMLEDMDDKLSEEQKIELNESLETLKESYGKKDIEKINKDIDDLNSKFQTISQSLYEQTTDEETKDEPSDVEFEEVN